MYNEEYFMDITMILGLTAGVITSVSFAPQVVKAYKTKKLEDVSYFMYIILYTIQKY